MAQSQGLNVLPGEQDKWPIATPTTGPVGASGSPIGKATEAIEKIGKDLGGWGGYGAAMGKAAEDGTIAGSPQQVGNVLGAPGDLVTRGFVMLIGIVLVAIGLIIARNPSVDRAADFLYKARTTSQLGKVTKDGVKFYPKEAKGKSAAESGFKIRDPDFS